jgi:hypothetical protein
MDIMTIDGAVANPGAPKNWDPELGTCGGLPIRVVRKVDSNEIAYCESAWRPTPEELAILNAGGNVVLRVVGWQCPVYIGAEEAGVACRDAAALNATMAQMPGAKVLEGMHGSVAERNYAWRKGMWIPAVFVDGEGWIAADPAAR